MVKVDCATITLVVNAHAGSNTLACFDVIAGASFRVSGELIATMLSQYQKLEEIAQDTVRRTEDVLRAVPEGSRESTFVSSQLPPLTPPPNFADLAPLKIEVLNIDSFTAARNIINEIPEARGQTAVLNLASDAYRAGGWLETLCTTQASFVPASVCGGLMR